MKNSKLKIFAFFVLLLVYNKFFEFKFWLEFSNRLLVLVYLFLLAFTIKRFSFDKGLFIRPVKYIIFSTFLAIIPCVLIWNQSLLESIVGIAPFSYFLLFLFLIQVNIKQEYIIKILLANAYLGLLLYTIQTFNSSTILFGYTEEFKFDRGIVRILFPGEGFMFFALFYYLNKIGRRFEIKYVIALIPFLIMMFSQVTRIYILAFVLIAIYHFTIKSNVKFRFLGIIFFSMCYLFFFNTDNKIVKGLREATNQDSEKIEDYIRVLSADYYLTAFSNNYSTYILGNGAYYHSSSYGKKILSINENENYYLEDLGLLKGYILFGILFVIGYILIFIKSFTVKIPYNKLYLKYYIWMVLILSFTTRANTNAGFGVVLVTILYLFEFAKLEQINLEKV